MNFLKRWLTKSGDKHINNDSIGERELMLSELEQAKVDWHLAREKLNDVLETDQIDYAIYAFQAAEKRYNMLIRKAKKTNLHALNDEKNMEG